MERAASSKSLNVLGTALATCEMTALVSGSIFKFAPQQGQATSNGVEECLAMVESYSENGWESMGGKLAQGGGRTLEVGPNLKALCLGASA